MVTSTEEGGVEVDVDWDAVDGRADCVELRAEEEGEVRLMVGSSSAVTVADLSPPFLSLSLSFSLSLCLLHRCASSTASLSARGLKGIHSVSVGWESKV